MPASSDTGSPSGRATNWKPSDFRFESLILSEPSSRAKGLSNWSTVWRHGLRNAMLPIITLVALSLGFIIGGAITVEYVFSYPGIGLLIVEAIDQRDYPVLQAAFLLLTLSVILFNLLADLLYFRLDPRVQE